MAALALAAGATGCAQIGPVSPPSSGLPKPVQDLSASRLGPDVWLNWTPPRLTSDGAAWQDRGAVGYRLCAWPGIVTGSTPPPPRLPPPVEPPQIPTPPPSGAGARTTPQGKLMPPCPHPQSLGEVTAPLRVALTRLLPAGGRTRFATLALYGLNANGEGAGWSNLVVVPLIPVAPPPRLESATPTADGVQLRWRPARGAPVAIYRNQSRIAVARPGSAAYLDASAAWNEAYTYFLRTLAGHGRAQVESADSNRLEVTPRDVFPPPVPVGLQAVVGASGVNLSWDAVRARDLAGYNLYRRLGDGPWQKRNSALLPTPVFEDTIPAGAKSAEYAATAVDQAGNESRRSPAATAYF